jgi:hypothetical protein
VAVVSISRIQIRRGRRTQLPQLASGEFGWSVDTQELYIGNGAVSEGAPYVGNTKLLSEHDDLFQFADTYTYRKDAPYIQTGDSPNSPVQRTLQARLDDRVSIRSFGAAGDGTDQTAAFQRAIDQLFLNPATKGTEQSRVTLFVEPGVYRVSGLYIPPYATIVGAGKDKTKIIATGTNPGFYTVNETSTPGNYAPNETSTTLNQARNIHISDMTVQTEGNIGIYLETCKDSVFENIKFVGTWSIGNGDFITNPAMFLGALSTATTCKNNKFNNIEVYNFSYAVVSDDDVDNNIWDNCKFDTLYRGFAFGVNITRGQGNQLRGPSHNTVMNSTFNDVEREAVLISAGVWNKSKNNQYFDCGNEGGGSGNAQHAILNLADQNNVSEDDWFKRTEELGYDAAYLINYKYTSEVLGPTFTTFNFPLTLEIGSYPSFTRLLRLPIEELGAGYEIDYIYRSTQFEATRSGRIEIVIDRYTERAPSIVDEYTYYGDYLYEDNLQFNVLKSDENGDTDVDTLVLQVLNSTVGDNATLTYTVRRKA